jgi:hypothetical protein
MSDYSEVYIYTDQPTACPKCGTRTSIIQDFYHTPERTQQHKCPSENCSFEFDIQIDAEI